MSNDQIVRSFNAFVGSLEDGKFHAELTQQLEEAVRELHDAAIERGGKAKAKIALTIDLKLDGGIVETAAEYKVTLPKAERGRTIFWETPEGHLSRANPKQTDMFRDVTGGSDAVRTVS
ncbi:hypothetical protein FRZ44_38350 [Hypericibacter terrae]|uniref:Uncharacterized protein n=1 Tax=Hypericibacter terrae TaxID=2602015 RepID=A0A5J6MLT4_9PROT|nr:hypothetical protein [Hypericibacter terrae]QEX18528.1 hypothetical protein FRZ44_38350 [Hypericibacter terrae]